MKNQPYKKERSLPRRRVERGRGRRGNETLSSTVRRASMRLFKYKLFTLSSGGERLQMFPSDEGTLLRGGINQKSIIAFQLGENSASSQSEFVSDGSVGSSTIRRLKAILLAILSGLAFTYCALTVHVLPHVSPSEVLLFRTVVQSLLIAPVAAWSLRGATPSEDTSILAGDRCTCTPWRSILAQGTVMAFSLQLLFIAFQRLPLGDASALIFSAPAHVSILGWAILGEKPNAAKCLAILGIVAGGILISQTTPGAQKPPGAKEKEEARSLDVAGLAAAWVGTLGYSLHYVLIRRLRNVHYSLTTLSLSVQTFLLSAVILLFTESFQIPNNGFEWALLSTVGIVGTAAHVLLAIALSMEEAAVVASTRSLDIAVAYVVQVAVCHEPLTSIGIGGAVLISICVFSIALEPYISPKLYQLHLNMKNFIQRMCERRCS